MASSRPETPDSPLAASTAPVVAVLDARSPAAWQRVGGIPLVTRLVRSLELAGLDRIRVVCPAGRTPAEAGARQSGTRIEVLEALAAGPLPARAGEGAEEVIAIDATLVVDRRLLKRVVDAKAPLVVEPTPAGAGEPGRVRLARLKAAAVASLGSVDGIPGAERLDPGTLPTWAAEVRGPKPILLMDGSLPGATRTVQDALLLATEKHVMDAPARWVDPYAENAIVRRLVDTPVTPNHVTFFSLAIGLAAAAFLYLGWWALALPVMFLVGWLDGVDGKMARLRLQYSRIGEAESLFDFTYENAWWLALTLHFVGSGQGAVAGWLGVAWLAANLVDEVAYTVAGEWLGGSLDLLTPQDGAFRLIAGRRNIYVYMLAAAVLAGSMWAGFVACSVWAAITAGVHLARLFLASRGVGVPEPLR
jgi:phosphatidylglycerophosphate synthase